jgi:hypothetical protein
VSSFLPLKLLQSDSKRGLKNTRALAQLLMGVLVFENNFFANGHFSFSNFGSGFFYVVLI